MSIGVAISTKDRRPLLLQAVPHWLKHLPADAPLVIVDDGSSEPVQPIDGATVIRHEHSRGVAATKNAGIAALMDAGCTDVFLADDDCWPIADNWWKPYVESPEHHLSYQWPRPNRYSKWSIVPQRGHPLEETHFAIGFPRGVMLYMDQHAIDTIGGMDPTYGRGEHVDYSYRAWLAGLTTFTQRDPNGETVAAYGDVIGSNLLWHAKDEHECIPSTFGDRDAMRRLDEEGARNWGRNWPDGKPAYFDPRTGERR